MARKSRNRRKNTKRKTRRRRVIKGGDPTIKSLPISLLKDVQGPLIDKFDLTTGLPKEGGEPVVLRFYDDIGKFGKLIYYGNDNIGRYSSLTRNPTRYVNISKQKFTVYSIKLYPTEYTEEDHADYIVDLGDGEPLEQKWYEEYNEPSYPEPKPKPPFKYNDDPAVDKMLERMNDKQMTRDYNGYYKGGY